MFGPVLHIEGPSRVADAMDFVPCQKWAKRVGFWTSFTSDGKHVTFEECLQTYISRGRRSAEDISMKHVRRSRLWFPQKHCILEHRIFRFAKMISRDRRSTLYDLASLFRGRGSTLDTWSGKIAKRLGASRQLCTSTFLVWRKSRRIASFLMLSN